MNSQVFRRRRTRRVALAVGLCSVLAMTVPAPARASDPVITDQYTADPSVRIFDGKLYLYPSHDRDDAEWYDMEDWHAFSSTGLTNWTDHGRILSVDSVGQSWSRSKAWAPDVAHKNGTYYFYFPVRSDENRDNTNAIGVATSSSPSGPFSAVSTPLITDYPQAFDPTVFVDSNGAAYIITGQRTDAAPHPWIARLNDDMTSLATQPEQMQFNGPSNFFEGPWMHKYNNKYYLSYAQNGAQLGYAVADNIFGPYTYVDVILDGLPYPSGTTHHSILPINGDWFIFYHNSQRSTLANEGNTPFKRSVVVDRLYYNTAGDIRRVNPTLGPPPTLTVDPSRSVNDTATGTSEGRFDYSSGWSSADTGFAFQGDNHYTDVGDASYRVRFDGTQIKVYGPRSPVDGDAVFSVRSRSGVTVVPETTVRLYSPAVRSSDLVFDSHPLPSGEYILEVRAVGNGYVNADRVEITGNPARSVNDAVAGDGERQFDYSNGWAWAASGYAFEGDNHYTNVEGATYRVRFNGSRIKVHSPRGPLNGSASFSVLSSSGATVVGETAVNLYSASDRSSDVVFDSGTLSSGQYTLRARATGNGYINADRVQVFNGS